MGTGSATKQTAQLRGSSLVFRIPLSGWDREDFLLIGQRGVARRWANESVEKNADRPSGGYLPRTFASPMSNPMPHWTPLGPQSPPMAGEAAAAAVADGAAAARWMAGSDTRDTAEVRKKTMTRISAAAAGAASFRLCFSDSLDSTPVTLLCVKTVNQTNQSPANRLPIRNISNDSGRTCATRQSDTLRRKQFKISQLFFAQASNCRRACVCSSHKQATAAEHVSARMENPAPTAAEGAEAAQKYPGHK